MPNNHSSIYRLRYNKIIIAFLLGCVTLLLSVGISKTTFRQMLNTVNQLSEPNPKLQLVNNIFKEVVQLDQRQRIRAIEQSSSKPYHSFLKESARLQYMLDTLAGLCKGNNTQEQRIGTIKNILHERDKLFLNYLYLRASLSKNDTLITQLKNLSELIAGTSKKADSNLVKTERKVTTTTVEHEDTSGTGDEKASFWDKLFGRKKVKRKEVERLVKEELKVKLDTVTLDKEDSIIQELGKTVAVEQTSRIRRRNLIAEQQLLLINKNNILIGDLLQVLKDIDAEETQSSDRNNALAAQLADRDARKMNWILIFFILFTAILAYLIITDIARSNRYRVELVAAKEEAERLEQVKQRFLANMSHELRTPLQTIIGVAEQMKMNRAAAPGQLDMFYQSSQHLLQIVNEVLDYSRIISGKFIFKNEPFDIQQTVTDVKNTLELQAAKKGLQFEYSDNFADHTYYVGDAFRLKQILYNLLGNAIKFTDVGKIALEVNSVLKDDHADCTFIIKDTGIGMTAEEIDKIFIEFETLNDAAVRKGTGLGLAIVKELVTAQGGSIHVDSAAGAGTTFTVALTFPIASGNYKREIKTVPELTGFDGTVWIVDDDPFILQLCETIFEKYGIAYRSFASPEEILNTPFDTAVRLVLLDIRLPGMNGMALCKLLKERVQATHIRFVALTAQVMPDETQSILQSGFDDLLAKPFLEKDLVNVVYHNKENFQQQHLPEIINLSTIYTMAGNDTKLVKQALDSFVAQTEHDLALLQQQLINSDRQEVAECLHRIAGRCGQVGANSIMLRIRKIEQQLRNGYRADVNEDITSVKEQVYVLMRQVAEEADKL